MNIRTSTEQRCTSMNVRRHGLIVMVIVSLISTQLSPDVLGQDIRVRSSQQTCCIAANVVCTGTLSGSPVFNPTTGDYSYTSTSQFTYDCTSDVTNCCAPCVDTTLSYLDKNGRYQVVDSGRYKPAGSSCGSTGNVLNLTTTCSSMSPGYQYKVSVDVGDCSYDDGSSRQTIIVFRTN